MKFKQKGEKEISTEEIKSLELKYNIVLPEDYREGMLKMNGYYASEELFFNSNVFDDEIEFFSIFPIKYGSTAFENVNGINDLNDYPEGHVIIGRSRTGYFSMSLNTKDYGSIHVFYSDGEMHKLADTFTEFLDGLEEL